MAIKGGVPKPATGSDQAGREAFINAAPGKAAVVHPWQDPRVRDDVAVQLNVKISEPLSLKLDWLVQQREAANKRALVEELLGEAVAARLKRRGVED